MSVRKPHSAIVLSVERETAAAFVNAWIGNSKVLLSSHEENCCCQSF